MTICSCNGKGGVGKTTVTMGIASALAESGFPVTINDYDPQGSISQWVDIIRANDPSSLIATTQSEGAPTHTLIDTPPDVSKDGFARGIAEADFILLITTPSPLDLWATKQTIERIKDLGKAQQAWLLFNRIETGTRLGRNLEVMTENLGLKRLSNGLSKRTTFQIMGVQGWNSLERQAKDELFQLVIEITGKQALNPV